MRSGVITGRIAPTRQRSTALEVALRGSALRGSALRGSASFGIAALGVASLVVFTSGCEGSVGGGYARGPERMDMQAPDAGTMAVPMDASPEPATDAYVPEPDGGSVPSFVAPAGTQPGATMIDEGEVELTVTADTPTTYRVEGQPGEHLAFRLDFSPSGADVDMVVERWTGTEVERMALTNAGGGIRTLAVFDDLAPRTFWVRVSTEESELEATLTVERTPFEDGATCSEDCERLMQFPLRNDPSVDGYDHSSGTIFRYQFGRRDLLMFVRHAAQEMAAAGYAPFYPEDFSQWDGDIPGADVGRRRHVSHNRGKDVDISLYGDDGDAHWRSFCEIRYNDGRECVAGTVEGYDGVANARYFAAIFESGRVTMSFLDQQLEPHTIDGAESLMEDGLLSEAEVDRMADTLRHWPNHDNHIHVRVSEEPYDDDKADDGNAGIGSSASALTDDSDQGC